MKNYRLYLLLAAFMFCISTACSDAVAPIPGELSETDAGLVDNADAVQWDKTIYADPKTLTSYPSC